MTKITFSREDESQLIKVADTNGLYLEGNLLKVIESKNEDFINYLQLAKDKDKESREKRLSLSKVVQDQNDSLVASTEER